MGRDKTGEKVPFSFLMDNIKFILILLVVFNHAIARYLVREDMTVRHIWYGITVFHMPAFIFVSGYFSKRPQNALKNCKNLLIPYVLGYSLTWYVQYAMGNGSDFELLRPTGTAMWYVLALFAYRITIEAFGRIRFVVPLSIIFALWAGTRPEFGTYLSASRIVVFFPFFVAGYLWKSEYLEKLRRFKGKWLLLPLAGFLLYSVPVYMIANNRPVDIFRGNRSYLVCGLPDQEGIMLRLLMYLVSFIIIFAMLALFPNIKLPVTFIGRSTMGIYFFHFPILIALSNLGIMRTAPMDNVWAVLGGSLVLTLVLGSLPVKWIYNAVLNLLTLILFKREKVVAIAEVQQAAEMAEQTETRAQRQARRRRAIEELAATLGEDDEE